MKPNADPAAKKPRVALLLATGFGLGYLPKAPGTAGSLLALMLAWAFYKLFPCGEALIRDYQYLQIHLECTGWGLSLALLFAVVGIYSSGRASSYLKEKDPQIVVIDEVSGQFLTLALAARETMFDRIHVYDTFPRDFGQGLVNWKYLLLGFILFRVFDIWKPFPVRQAERLPGGWGIMADDWVAAIYAALGLWVARSLGL